MTQILVFPLTLRSPSEGRCEGTAELVVFPHGRRRQLVDQHIRAMRHMSDDDRELHLTKVLEGICEELHRLGIDCQATDAIEDFADAIGKQLHGPSFVLKAEGGAE